MHCYWGIVEIVSDEMETILLPAGRTQELVWVFPSRLYQMSPSWSFALQAWPEHLTPLTPAAAEMLAIVKGRK